MQYNQKNNLHEIQPIVSLYSFENGRKMEANRFLMGPFKIFSYKCDLLRHNPFGVKLGTGPNSHQSPFSEMSNAEMRPNLQFTLIDL